MAHDSLRIGVVDQASAGWTAAATYSKMILRSLSSIIEADDLYFLTSQPNAITTPAKVIELAAVAYLPGERGIRKSFSMGDKHQAWRGEARLRRLLKMPDASSPFSIADNNHIDVLLPLLDVPPWPVRARLIGWIPDFQHLHLPEYFHATEVDKRNATIRKLVERANLIMLSSNAARNDFIAFSPQAASKVRVLPFPSLLAFESLAPDPRASRIKFNLPEKFALVANQFWAHKNHKVVVTAVAQLRDRGITVPIVMTGLPIDFRDRDNNYLSSLLQAIASAGLNSQITVLGQVPYTDLINLMRTAAVVIQPSRFEGWSTVVEDAKALGRPLLCSDIGVHHEQAPAGAGFFQCDAPTTLADLLADYWSRTDPGPDPESEILGLVAERAFAKDHASILATICKEACA